MLTCLCSMAVAAPPEGNNGEGVVVELTVEQGRYDVAPLQSVTEQEVDRNSDRIWYPFTSRTRLGLVLLEARGTIASYEILPNRVRIEFAPQSAEKLRETLFPPALLNLDEYAGEKAVVVMVHGLEGGPSTYCELAPAFANHEWFPLQLVYPNDAGVQRPAEYLLRELKKLHRQYPATRVAVIAHSLGGLVAWKALSDSEAGSAGVTDLVTLGTPFGGSSLAQFQEELELSDVGLRMLQLDWSGLDIAGDGSGEAVQILLPESSQRRALLKTPLAEGVRLHLIAGDGGPVGKGDRHKFRGLVERLIDKLEPQPAFAASLRQFAESRELLNGFGDGAVTVDSATDVPTYDSRRVFSRTHTGLLSVSTDDDEVFTWIVSQLNAPTQAERRSRILP